MQLAVSFQRKGTLLPDAIDNVDYDVPGEVHSTHPAWTTLMFNIPKLPKEESIYKREKEEFGVKDVDEFGEEERQVDGGHRTELYRA